MNGHSFIKKLKNKFVKKIMNGDSFLRSCEFASFENKKGIKAKKQLSQK